VQTTGQLRDGDHCQAGRQLRDKERLIRLTVGE
jgi:hypothetical protein